MFEPNWASPPGDTISRLAVMNNVLPSELAERIGLEDDEFAGIMEGSISISEDIASMLSAELGASCEFWKRRYEQFIADKLRLEVSTSNHSLLTWGHLFPTRSLRELGWIPKNSRGERLSKDILHFFGCENISAWNERYSTGIGQVAFRTSFSFKTDELATLAWLRVGETQSKKIFLKDFSALKFRERLPMLKRLCAFKHPSVFFAKLQKECADLGVALVCSRAPTGCRASGATWVNNDGNPIIMLSFRYLSEDHFWFTFFHEAAHVVLHGTDHISIDGTDPSPLGSSNCEDEANIFAKNVLIPKPERDEIFGINPIRANVRKAARKINVTPGILVGQLQKAQIIQPRQLNDLKRRYQWKENSVLPVIVQPRK